VELQCLLQEEISKLVNMLQALEAWQQGLQLHLTMNKQHIMLTSMEMQ